MGNLLSESNHEQSNEVSAAIRIIDRNSRIIEDENKIIVEDISSRFLKL